MSSQILVKSAVAVAALLVCTAVASAQSQPGQTAAPARGSSTGCRRLVARAID